MNIQQSDSTTTVPAVTLGHLITRISHVVINVSDLEKSREFYEWSTPLRVVNKISAPRQRFAGLEIEDGEFEGYVLDDGTGGEPATVHLVEWKTPAPVGKPYPVFWNVGFAKLGFATSMPWEERVALLQEGGAELTNDKIARGYVSFFDPDGTTLSYYQDLYSTRRHDLWFHVNPVATDRDRSISFYRDVLGLDNYRDVYTDEPLPSSQGPGSNLAQWSSHVFSGRGDRRFNIDMTQPVFPAPSPETSTPYEEANHLGIVRVGLEVEDIDLAYELLQAVEPIGQAPGLTGPPESWDLGGDLGTRRVLSLRDPDGIRVELVEKLPRPASSSFHFGADGIK